MAIRPAAGESVPLDGERVIAPGSARPRGGPPAPAWRRWTRCWRGEVRSAFCAVRPPGHHAEPRPADGLLPVLQRRRRRAPRPGGARRSRGWRSSISTCTTATAPRTSSRAMRASSTASTHQCRSIPAPAMRATGRRQVVNVPLRPAPSGAAFRAGLAGVLPAVEALRAGLMVSRPASTPMRAIRWPTPPAGGRFRLGDRRAVRHRRTALRRPCRQHAGGWLRPRCAGEQRGGACAGANASLGQVAAGGGSERVGRDAAAAVALPVPEFELVTGEGAAGFARAVPEPVGGLLLALPGPPGIQLALPLGGSRRAGGPCWASAGDAEQARPARKARRCIRCISAFGPTLARVWLAAGAAWRKDVA